MKDEFPLPNNDMIGHSTIGHALVSFMNEFYGYNQIVIPPCDQYKTTFITPWRKFYWGMIPYGLINADVTYQQAMNLILHEYVHNILEDYVGNILLKSMKQNEYNPTLRQIFERVWKYNIYLNH